MTFTLALKNFLKKPIHGYKEVAALTDADATLTTAQMLGGLATITPGAGRAITTPTAADIIASLPDGSVGRGFEFTIVCLAAYAATLTAGSGVTIVGSAVANNAAATWYVRVASATTVVIYRM